MLLAIELTLLLLHNALSWREAVKMVKEQRETAPPRQILPAYRSAIRVCGQAGKWQAALNLLQQLRDDDGPPDSGCYAEAMKACRKNGAWSTALMLHEDLRREAPPDVFTTSNAIAACEPAGLWRRALDLLSAQPEANNVCVNAAIATCARARRWREALQLLDELEKPEAATGGGDSAKASVRTDPTLHSYASAMTACTRAGRWSTALDVMDRMQARRVRLDSATYLAAMAACAEGAQVDRALSTLETMRRSGVSIDVRVYNSAISACAKARVWQPARQLLKDMSTFGVTPTVRTFNAVLAAASASRKWQAALRVLESIEEAGLTPNHVSYGTAIAACERCRQWQPALDLLNSARRRGVADVPATNSAISALARGSGWEAALQVLRRMENAAADPDDEHIEDATHGDHPPSERHSGRRAAVQPVLQPDARSYGPIVLAIARKGDWRRALDLVEGEMTERRVPIGPYAGSALIGALGRANQWKKALEMLKRIDRPNVECFTAAAGACGRARQGDAAIALLDEMDARGLKPDPQALQTFAWAAGRGGGWAASLATLLRLRSDAHSMDPVDFLGVALAVCEDEEGMYGLLRAANDAGIEIDALSFYSAVLQGWQGSATASPVAAAARLLRGLAQGELPPSSDLRAWNMLCESALADDPDGDESAIGQAEVARMIDAAYARAVEAGALSHWVADLRDGDDSSASDPAGEASDAGQPGSEDQSAMVDLHGYSVHMARAATRRVMEELRDESRGGASIDDQLLVITGRGKGSTTEAVIGPAVLRVLRDELTPPVTADVVRGNDGRLQVDGASLRRWLAANPVGEQ